MKIKKLWVEFENDHGETLLRPATDDDLEYFRYKPNPGALQRQPGPVEAESQDLGFPTWEPGPGYTLAQIEAERLKPEDLRGACAR